MTNRNDYITQMEPLLLPEGATNRADLMDLVLDLTQKSAQFKTSLPSAIQSSLTATVRSMNCYYSNLIEGHNTHPIAIRQALKMAESRDLFPMPQFLIN